MNIMIENGARQVTISGHFQLSLVTTSTDGAYLSLDPSRRECFWIHQGRWFQKRHVEETLTVFSGDGRHELKLVEVLSDRILLRISGEEQGKRVRHHFWLLKRPKV